MLVFASSLAWTQPALAQMTLIAGDAKELPPVQVQVSENAVPPGASVIISGTSPASDVRSFIASVRLPQGGTDPLTVTIEPNGGFKATFKNTKATGTYVVTIAVRGVATPGTAKFDVITGTAYLSSFAKDFQADLDLAVELEQAVQAAYRKVPNSPAKVKADGPMATLPPLMTTVIQQGSVVPRDLGELDDLRPELPLWMGELDRRIVSFERDSREEEESLRQQAREQIARSKQDGVVCEQLEVVRQGLKFASALFILTGKKADILLEVASEAAAEKLKHALPEGTGLATSALAEELVKRSPTAVKTLIEKAGEGPLKGFQHFLANDAHKILTDVTGVVAEGFFEHYCEQFEGSFKATMKAEFTQGLENRLWWQYESIIEGKLTLRYAKESRGSAVHVDGEFMGQATKLKVTYENAMPVFYPKIMRVGTLLWKFIRDPVTAPISLRPELFGKIVASGSPHSFKILVHGELADEKLSLDLGAAIWDFDDKTRVTYLMYSPLLAIPVATVADLPFKDGHFILMRAMGGEHVQFDVETDKEEMSFVRDFQNEAGSGDMKGWYKMHIKACNPECK